jgi:hypothetical protein
LIELNNYRKKYRIQDILHFNYRSFQDILQGTEPFQINNKCLNIYVKIIIIFKNLIIFYTVKLNKSYEELQEVQLVDRIEQFSHEGSQLEQKN